MKGNKILTMVAAILGLIGVVLFARVVMAGDEAITTDPAVQDSVVDPLVTFSKILLYIAIGVTVVLSILGLLKNPSALKKTVLGLAVLGILFAIAYFIGDSNVVLDPQGAVIEGGEEGSSTNKWTSTGIWYSLILLVIGGVFFVIDLLKGLVKS